MEKYPKSPTWNSIMAFLTRRKIYDYTFINQEILSHKVENIKASLPVQGLIRCYKALSIRLARHDRKCDYRVLYLSSSIEDCWVLIFVTLKHNYLETVFMFSHIVLNLSSFKKLGFSGILNEKTKNYNT